MTPEKFDRVMTRLIDKMGLEIYVTSENYSDNGLVGAYIQCRENPQSKSSFSYMLGYPFYFMHDKENNILTPVGDISSITKYDLFKLLPPKLVNDYFSNKVKEYMYQCIKEGKTMRIFRGLGSPFKKSFYRVI